MDNRAYIMDLLNIEHENGVPIPEEVKKDRIIEQLKQRNAELAEQVKQTKADMESMRAEFKTRLSEVISKSGIKFDKGSLNNPYEWKPLLLVVTGLYYEHDGVVKKCIDGGISKDFESRFEVV